MKDLDKELAYQVFEKSEEIKLLKKQIKDKYKQMELIVKNNLKSSKKIVEQLNKLKEEIMLLNFLIDELKKERKILSFQIKSYNEDLTRTRKRKQKNKKKS